MSNRADIRGDHIVFLSLVNGYYHSSGVVLSLLIRNYQNLLIPIYQHVLRPFYEYQETYSLDDRQCVQMVSWLYGYRFTLMVQGLFCYWRWCLYFERSSLWETILKNHSREANSYLIPLLWNVIPRHVCKLLSLYFFLAFVLFVCIYFCWRIIQLLLSNLILFMFHNVYDILVFSHN